MSSDDSRCAIGHRDEPSHGLKAGANSFLDFFTTSHCVIKNDGSNSKYLPQLRALTPNDAVDFAVPGGAEGSVRHLGPYRFLGVTTWLANGGRERLSIVSFAGPVDALEPVAAFKALNSNEERAAGLIQMSRLAAGAKHAALARPAGRPLESS